MTDYALHLPRGSGVSTLFLHVEVLRVLLPVQIGVRPETCRVCVHHTPAPSRALRHVFTH